ncbi:chorismate--pyruvate lyase family protein [Shewanella sp.]|uniref:chorismate--pyruvate lyase family protein n=1 Tax=Shewanella sp. TaxID=50422 RepID=UPI00405402F3
MNVTSLSFPYGESIQWFSPERADSIAEPQLKDWLLATGSLTLRLKSLCHHFEVKVLGEQLSAISPADNDLIEPVWVREVLLCLDDTPWVFARTLVPQALLDFKSQAFTQLGNKPLGELLYSSPEIIPGKIELARFDKDCKLAQLAASLAQNVSEPLWGRRRHFSLKQTNLTVSEIFLPAAVAHIHQLKKKRG